MKSPSSSMRDSLHVAKTTTIWSRCEHQTRFVRYDILLHCISQRRSPMRSCSAHRVLKFHQLIPTTSESTRELQKNMSKVFLTGYISRYTTARPAGCSVVSNITDESRPCRRSMRERKHHMPGYDVLAREVPGPKTVKPRDIDCSSVRATFLHKTCSSGTKTAPPLSTRQTPSSRSVSWNLPCSLLTRICREGRSRLHWCHERLSRKTCGTVVVVSFH